MYKMTKTDSYARNGKILSNRFCAFLLPSILSGIAAALDEFVDSIIVSKLLGSTAMSIVNMSMPMMTMYACIFMLFGTGGAAVYAKFLGQMDRKTAGASFTGSLMAAAIVSILITLVGFLNTDWLTALLCNVESLQMDFSRYTKIVLISAPIIILLQFIICYLPAAGYPKFSAVLNLIANGINLVFDILYIQVFHTGVEGAAYATLTGYIVAFVVLFIAFFRKKIHIQAATPKLSLVRRLPECIRFGSVYALGQLLLSMKLTYSNHIAAQYAGESGVVAFSVCLQLMSIVSIFISAAVGVMVPLGSSLYGQKDYQGVKIVTKKCIIFISACMAVCIAVFEIYPQFAMILFSIKDAEAVDMCCVGIRIFSIVFLFRAVALSLIYELQIIGKTVYSLLLSIFDGVAGIVLISTVLCPFLGVNGLWWAYVFTAIILSIAIPLINFASTRHHEPALDVLTLLPKENECTGVFSKTVTGNMQDYEEVVKQLNEFCLKMGLSKSQSNIVSVASEEMSVITLKHHEGQKNLLTDILVRISDSEFTMDFRSLGSPFDVMSVPDTGEFSNLSVLKKIADDLTFDYIMGMNQTRITIKTSK